MALTLVTAATAEPVTLVEAKNQIRVDITDDDGYIAGLISVARARAETISRRALITQTWDWVFDAWPRGDTLTVPLPPLQSVTSITYTDDDGNSDTIASADYIVDTDSEPGRIVLKSSATWPGVTLQEANAITVRFVAGYGDAGNDVPAEIRQAVLLILGHWYENREDTLAVGNIQKLPMGAEALLWSDRIVKF